MADSTSFQVIVRTDHCRKKLLDKVLSYGQVVYDWKGGKVRFHVLSEGTISIANTGAATNTVLRQFDASTLSFQQNACFNATLKNMDIESQILMGLIVMYDHTTTSPDTDAATIEVDIDWVHAHGNTPSYDVKTFNLASKHEIQSDIVVEASITDASKYCGPLAVPLGIPIKVGKENPVYEYFATYTKLNQASYAAHTVVTTYTIKVAAWAVLCDEGVLEAYGSPDEFWEELLKGD